MNTYLTELKKLNKRWDVPIEENEHWILRDRVLLDISQYEKQNELVEQIKNQTEVFKTEEV